MVAEGRQQLPALVLGRRLKSFPKRWFLGQINLDQLQTVINDWDIGKIKNLRPVICWGLPKSSQQFTFVRCKSISVTSAFCKVLPAIILYLQEANEL